MFRIWLLQLQLPLSHLKQEESRRKGALADLLLFSLTISYYDAWPVWPEDGTGQKGRGWVSDLMVSVLSGIHSRGVGRGVSRSGCNGFFCAPCYVFSHSFSAGLSGSQSHWQHTFIILSPWPLNTNEVEHMCYLIIFPRIFPFIFFVFFSKLFSYSFKSGFYKLKLLTLFVTSVACFPFSF